MRLCDFVYAMRLLFAKTLQKGKPLNSPQIQEQSATMVVEVRQFSAAA